MAWTDNESLRRSGRRFGGIIIISVRFDLFVYSGRSFRFDPISWTGIGFVSQQFHPPGNLIWLVDQRIKKANLTLSSDQVYEEEMAIAKPNMLWV